MRGLESAFWGAPLTVTLRAAARSDVGCHRVVNEDRYAMAPGLGLFLVADGVGGHRSGQIASGLAAHVTVATVREFRGDSIRPLEVLRHAVDRAHREIGRRARRKRALHGMGTTLVAALMTTENRITLAHVGDSRAYLIRDRGIRQLTVDHSWVGEMVQRRQMTEADARAHPQRHVLTRALGMPGSARPEFLELTLQADDRLLLCSDGLTEPLSDDEILSHVLSAQSPESACALLVHSAIEKGGLDNVTSLLLCPPEA